jgi:molecular chaperone GrpE
MKIESKTSPSPEPAANDTGGPTAATEPDALRNDLARQKDLHLRLAADFENYKRRSRREAEARAAAQIDALMLELLPVSDNLERALAAGAARDSVQFFQGVEMTLKQLHRLLRQHGVESDEAVGLPFDPHRQEALAQGHDPDLPDHVVLTVLQRGYRRGEIVVRPAKVTVNDRSASRDVR